MADTGADGATSTPSAAAPKTPSTAHLTDAQVVNDWLKKVYLRHNSGHGRETSVTVQEFLDIIKIRHWLENDSINLALMLITHHMGRDDVCIVPEFHGSYLFNLGIGLYTREECLNEEGLFESLTDGKRWVVIPCNDGWLQGYDKMQRLSDDHAKEQEEERIRGEEARREIEGVTEEERVEIQKRRDEEKTRAEVELQSRRAEVAGRLGYGAHWGLLIIDKETKIARWVDSLVTIVQRDGKDHFEMLRAGTAAGKVLCGFEHLLGSKFGFERGCCTTSTLKYVPHQTRDNQIEDGGACGPYMYAFLEYIYRNHSQGYMQDLRRVFSKRLRRRHCSAMALNSGSTRQDMQDRIHATARALEGDDVLPHKLSARLVNVLSFSSPANLASAVKAFQRSDRPNRPARRGGGTGPKPPPPPPGNDFFDESKDDRRSERNLKRGIEYLEKTGKLDAVEQQKELTILQTKKTVGVPTDLTENDFTTLIQAREIVLQQLLDKILADKAAQEAAARAQEERDFFDRTKTTSLSDDALQRAIDFFIGLRDEEHVAQSQRHMYNRLHQVDESIVTDPANLLATSALDEFYSVVVPQQFKALVDEQTARIEKKQAEQAEQKEREVRGYFDDKLDLTRDDENLRTGIEYFEQFYDYSTSDAWDQELAKLKQHQVPGITSDMDVKEFRALGTKRGNELQGIQNKKKAAAELQQTVLERNHALDKIARDHIALHPDSYFIGLDLAHQRELALSTQQAPENPGKATTSESIDAIQKGIQDRHEADRQRKQNQQAAGTDGGDDNSDDWLSDDSDQNAVQPTSDIPVVGDETNSSKGGDPVPTEVDDSTPTGDDGTDEPRTTGGGPNENPAGDDGTLKRAREELSDDDDALISKKSRLT